MSRGQTCPKSDIRNLSFDVDLPIECDDEYWINPDPNLAFKQPEGKPSTVVFFNCVIRLIQIHAFALRTIVRPFECPLCNITRPTIGLYNLVFD